MENNPEKSMNPHFNDSLLDSEWMLVGSLLFIMISLTVVGIVNAARCSSILTEHPAPSHELCAVAVTGEVSRPGTFLVPPGTLLKKVVRKSSPTPCADLKKIDLEQRVEESMNIHVETLTEVTITIRGLHQDSIQLTVPARTRVCHLKKFISEDLKPFEKCLKSRRFLRDFEEIVLVKNEKTCTKFGVCLISLTDINKFVQ